MKSPTTRAHEMRRLTGHSIRPVSLVVTVLVALVASGTAHACEIQSTPEGREYLRLPLEARFDDAMSSKELVFLARLTERKPHTPAKGVAWTEFVLSIEHQFKGALPSRVSARYDMSCDAWLEPDKLYLIFARRDSAGYLSFDLLDAFSVSKHEEEQLRRRVTSNQPHAPGI